MEGLAHLFNPISGSKIELPGLVWNLDSKPDITKAVVSCDPSRNNYFFVVVNYTYGLLYTRKNRNNHGEEEDNTWNLLAGVDCEYCDIVFNDGYLFAVSRFILRTGNSVEVWDLKGELLAYPVRIMNLQPSTEWEVLSDPLIREIHSFPNKCSLVESEGELFWVELFMVSYHNDDDEKRSCPKSLRFSVLKLNLGANKWEKVDHLHDRAFCLGENLSGMSLSTEKFPEVKESSIYFAAEYIETKPSGFHDHDLLVYDLEDKLCKSYSKSGKIRSKTRSPLCWIVPNSW